MFTNKRHFAASVDIAVYSRDAALVRLVVVVELEGVWCSFQGTVHPDRCSGRFSFGGLLEEGEEMDFLGGERKEDDE